MDEMEQSSLMSVREYQKVPPQVLEAREKKKFLRTEQRFFRDEDNPNPFMRKQVDDRVLINFLVELVIKANNLLQLASNRPGQAEELKVLETSLNKEGILIDKSKIVIVQLGLLSLILPFTITKIEVRMRNVLINQRNKMESISRFLQFYLELLEKQNATDIADEEAQEHQLKLQRMNGLDSAEQKDK